MGLLGRVQRIHSFGRYLIDIIKDLNFTNMAIVITEECINCGACEPECPNNAIYENGANWNYSDGTALTEIELEDGSALSAEDEQEPITDGAFGADGNEFYYIVPSKCTECIGFH